MTLPESCPNCHARLPRRADFLPPTYGRESIFGVTAFVAGYGGVMFVLWHIGWTPYLWPAWLGRLQRPVPNLVIGAAGYGVWLAVEGVLIMIVWYVLQKRQPPPAPEEEADEFAATARNTLRRLPRGVRQQRLWQFLIGVARDCENVTLSQRGAAAYGFSQAQANDIKDWCCEVGWYEVINGANGYGQWTAEGERILAMLAQHPPALWRDIVDPPTDDDAYRPERAVLDQHAPSSTGNAAGVGGTYELEPWTD